MFILSAFKKLLIPAGRFALNLIIREVFNSEFKVGSGNGVEKLAKAVENIGIAFASKRISIDPDEIRDSVNAVVAVLNEIGMFDDEPGLKVADIGKLIEAVLKAVEVISDMIYD